ncbi:hypothetical protein [Aureivirga marina]|uniref:hypothetical protein n=1 Tax=Aureivirga marina TaxID=1182451 RepID=UPI0018CB6CD5|nr:hypothetical protein [Aureivirga marina]
MHIMFQKTLIFFVLIFSQIGFAQIAVTLEKEIPLEASDFIGIDAFDNIYYTQNNVLYKKTSTQTLSYTNINLGELSSVDITDPTKIVLFYKDFSSAEILNRNLIRIETIEFLDLNVSFLRKSVDSYFWIFSDVTQKVYLYDYRLKRIVQETEIIRNSNIEKMYSTFNFCWLITEEKTMLKVDSQLNILPVFDKVPVSKISGNNNQLAIKSENTFYQLTSDKNLKKIDVSAKGIYDFYLNENYLYIFERKRIKIYKISKND